MNAASLGAILLVSVALSGCAATVQTSRLTANTLHVEDSVDGIVYYEPRLVELRFEYQQLKVPGGVSDDCIKTRAKSEFIVLPDYSKPRLISIKPQWWSTTALQVTLDRGMLVSVNATVTPQAPAQIAPVLAQVVAGVGALGVAVKARCDTSPVALDFATVSFPQ